MPLSHVFDPNASPAFEQLTSLIRARESVSASEAAAGQREYERALQERLVLLGRELTGQDLARLDVNVAGVIVDGERYRRKGPTTLSVTTLYGTVEVLCTLYEVRGGHGGKSCVPLEMQLGALPGWTPAAAEVASLFMAHNTSRESARLMSSGMRLTVSPSHLDRLPKRFEAAWEPRRLELEACVRDSSITPDRAELIMASLDGVMVPMKDAARVVGAKKEDLGPKGHKEASCGTLALFARGERQHTIRLGRMPESKKVTLHSQMEAELRVLDDYYSCAQVLGVADGAAENWRILGELDRKLTLKMRRVLDFYHLQEHLSEAFKLYHNRPEDAASELSLWHERLLKEPEAPKLLLTRLTELVEKSRGPLREELGKTRTYVENHQDMMPYPELVAKGWPIGSGLQEAACKTLVVERMKQSGMSWRQPGGQGILTLRSLEQSGRLELAWGALHPKLVRPFEIDPDTRRQPPRRAAA